MKKYSFILVALCAFLSTMCFTSCNNSDEEYLEGKMVGATCDGGHSRTATSSGDVYQFNNTIE